MLRNVTLVYFLDVHTFYLVMMKHWMLQRHYIMLFLVLFSCIFIFFVITTFMSSRMQCVAIAALTVGQLFPYDEGWGVWI